MMCARWTAWTAALMLICNAAWGQLSLGDYAEDATVNFKFNTMGQNFAPITLAGTPSLAVYKGSSTTESAAGITLTVDFDTITGMHHVTIDTSADAFYTAGADYQVVIAAGTADGVSLVGAVIATFSIEDRYERGTDSALLAASAPTNFGDLAITETTGRMTVGTNLDKSGYSISGTKTTLDALTDIDAAGVRTAVGMANANLDTQIGNIYTDTQRVDALIEDSTGDRFTSKALEQAPGGGSGGDATLAKQNDILAAVGALDFGDATLAKQDEILATLASVDSVPGPGATQWTATLETAGQPIADAAVWITTDAAGSNVVAGTLRTNDQGKVTFLLDAGQTYYMWARKSGMNPILGQSFVATGS
jgi:hypothetical protein